MKFGLGKIEPYSSEHAGFDLDTLPTLLKNNTAGSDKPFYFSAKVEEGNYRVTVELGGDEVESVTTVKAESRRLMLETIATEPGKTATRSFIVNIRTPKLPDGEEVRLKRDKNEHLMLDWDDKLTLEFLGKHPCVKLISIEKVDVPTIYLAGDSTVCDQGGEPWNSWGQMLTRFFSDKVAIANHAYSGESLSSFMGEKRLEKVLGLIKKGDWLFIQMGHNDMKQKGPENAAFTGYSQRLVHFIEETRKRDATPVLLTPMNRKIFDAAGKVTNSHGDFPDAVRKVAREKGVALIDLHAMSKTLYEAVGREHINDLFVDNTHHNNFGSYLLSRCVVEGIRENKLELVKFLVDDAGIFDPAKPGIAETFAVPASAARDPSKPLGN